MKVRAALLVAICAACVAVPGHAALPVKVSAVRTEVLQFAHRAHAPGAARTGHRLVTELRALGLAPHRFTVLPMVTVTGTPAQLARARSLSGVLYAHPAERIQTLLDQSVPLVFRGPPEPVRAANGDATGVRVAVVDTGIDATHPDLGPRILQNVRFVNGEAVTCPVACDTDDDGHGTEVAGVVANPGRPDGHLAGMVPGADLVGLSWDTTDPLSTVALSAFDYVLAHPELNIRVVNNSWGPRVSGPFDPTDPVNQATKMLHDAGVAVVFAVGNSGGTGAPAAGEPIGSSNCIDGAATDCEFSSYASAPWVISVTAGSTITPGTAPEDQGLWSGASRGDPRPAKVGGLEVSYEPTLTAPGQDIVTTSASVGPDAALKCVPALCRGMLEPLYTFGTGTSLAAPHVAGAIALLQSAAKLKLGRYLTPDEVKGVLVEGAAHMTREYAEPLKCNFAQDPASEVNGCGTAPPAHFAPWQVGAGYLDVPGALKALNQLVEDQQ